MGAPHSTPGRPGIPAAGRTYPNPQYQADGGHQSLLIAHGGDVKVVQARLRHASAKTTLDTYTHLWPDADESTRIAIGGVIAQQMDSSERATAYSLRTDHSTVDIQGAPAAVTLCDKISGMKPRAHRNFSPVP